MSRKAAFESDVGKNKVKRINSALKTGRQAPPAGHTEDCEQLQNKDLSRCDQPRSRGGVGPCNLKRIKY